MAYFTAMPIAAKAGQSKGRVPRRGWPGCDNSRIIPVALRLAAELMSPRGNSDRRSSRRQCGPTMLGGRRCQLAQVYNSSQCVRIPGIGAWRSLASALDWGSRGRRFKSCRPDYLAKQALW